MAKDLRERLLEAALPNVAFEGWGDATFRTAIKAAGVDPTLARAACPRGAYDLAVAYHRNSDQEMVRRLDAADLKSMRFRDRVTAAVRFRLEVISDKEAVRRAAALFALPFNAPDGARLVWGTADLIWTTLGDTSEDYNWYTKRATLSAVYTTTLLFWLGDQSSDNEATWAFLDRRIEDVMQFEKVKKRAQDSALGQAFMSGPGKIFDHIRRPNRARDDLPGHIKPQR